MPSWSSLRFNSLAEHIIPSESWPRSFAFFISNPPLGTTAPIFATHTNCPASTFGAPQTIFNKSPVPTSTLQTLSLSASGCLAFSTTLPTTKSLNFSPSDSMLSISSPAEIILAFNSSIEPISKPGMYSLTQFKLNFIIL